MKRRYILVACLAAALRAQAQNIPASGFGPQQIIAAPASGAFSVYATDLDQDGDMDVLSASSDDNKIAWYENQSDGSFGEQQAITTGYSGDADPCTGDIDPLVQVLVLKNPLYDNFTLFFSDSHP